MMTRTLFMTLAIALGLGCTLTANAWAFTVFAIDDPGGPTPEDLAELLVGEGVSLITNVRYTGAPNASGAFIEADGTGLGINQGVILTSGDVTIAHGPNDLPDATRVNGQPGSPLLDPLTTAPTYDASVLEFDFIPTGNELTFRYVFASEEYNEYVGYQFNDVFGFFVNGVNQALIPGTDTPVAINNVNLYLNSEFYRNNSDPDQEQLPIDPEFPTEAFSSVQDLQSTASFVSPINLQYDGFTTVLEFLAKVNPGVMNTMQLAIADAGDEFYDSAAFIGGGTFSSNVADGTETGETAQNPFMPSLPVGTIDPANPEPFIFQDILFTDSPYFIDPYVAEGYIYQVLAGSNFASVILPALPVGDNSYDLLLWDLISGQFTATGEVILAGEEYFFASGGVDRFMIAGIELGNMLDPADPTAFVTGLTHISGGTVSISQTPVSVFVTAQAPLPATLWLIALGLAGIARLHRSGRGT